MKALMSNQSTARILAAQMKHRVPNAKALFDMGLQQIAIALAADAPPSFDNTEHWRRAPFGAKGRGVKANKRAAMKRRAVRRARKLGHA